MRIEKRRGDPVVLAVQAVLSVGPERGVAVDHRAECFPIGPAASLPVEAAVDHHVFDLVFGRHACRAWDVDDIKDRRGTPFGKLLLEDGNLPRGPHAHRPDPSAGRPVGADLLAGHTASRHLAGIRQAGHANEEC